MLAELTLFAEFKHTCILFIQTTSDHYYNWQYKFYNWSDKTRYSLFSWIYLHKHIVTISMYKCQYSPFHIKII